MSDITAVSDIVPFEDLKGGSHMPIMNDPMMRVVMMLRVQREQGRRPLWCKRCRKFAHAPSETCSCSCCTNKHAENIVAV